jgi:peptidoglycan/LPS O-acetylase OafA/YrhL
MKGDQGMKKAERRLSAFLSLNAAAPGLQGRTRFRRPRLVLFVVGCFALLVGLLVLRFHCPTPPSPTGQGWLYYGMQAALLGFFAWGVVRLSTALRGADLLREDALFRSSRKFDATRGYVFDPLLALRFIACLFVLGGHGMAIAFHPYNLNKVLDQGSPVALLVASPWAGVWIFFVLSGYLMGKGFVTGRYLLQDDGLLRFYRNRMLRILPLYFIASFFVAVLQHPDIFQRASLPAIASLLLMDYRGGLSSGLIGALWSINTEFEFYLLVPFLFLILSGLQARRPAMTAALMVFFLGFGLWYRHAMLYPDQWIAWGPKVYTPLIGNIDLFACGFLLNYSVQGCRDRLPALGWGWVAAAGIIFVPYYIAISWWSVRGMVLVQPQVCYSVMSIGPTLTAVVVMGLIFILEAPVLVVVSRGWWDPRLLLLKGISFLGILTYSIYVWHSNVFMAVGDLPHRWNVKQAIAIWLWNIAKVLVLAVISYFLIELPFDRKKSNPVKRLPVFGA